MDSKEELNKIIDTIDNIQILDALIEILRNSREINHESSEN